MTQSYCIVGGGISGLTVAYRLRAALGDTARITLFDPADRLGGVLRTERVGGLPMDVGAEAFVLRRPEVPALLAELGLSDRQLGTTGARPLIYAGRRLHPVPADTVNGIPSSGRSLAGLVDDATIARVDAEPDRPLSWRPGDDPAVGTLVAERFGEQVVARSVDPLLAGVYAGSAATIGLRAVVPAVAAALDRGAPSLTDAVLRALPPATGAPVFGTLVGGYTELVDALVARSWPTWIRAVVDRIDRAERGWRLRDATGGAWPADAVVLAVPATQLVRLTRSFAPATAAAAARISHASAAVVALAVSGDTAFPNHSGVLVASGERLRAKAITLSSRKWGTRGEAGRMELLRLSYGRFGDTLAAKVADGELVDWAVQDLGTVFGLDVDPLDASVRRWLGAMPQYGPGHAELVAELVAGLPPTMAVAGNYLDGIGVPACVGAAGRAVSELLAAGVAR